MHPDWPVMADTIIKTDNMAGKIHNSFLTPYLPIVSGYTDLLLFTMYAATERHILAHDVVNGFYPKVLIKE